MPITLGDLLDTRELGLSIAAGGTRADADAAIVTWVHNSDLGDPTPWLEPGNLLLTDGLQFVPEPSAAQADSYLQRLADAGVVALGFATGVVHAEVPRWLTAACDRRGFLLIEVANRTPFIAIIRHLADRTAAEQRVQLESSLSAQRAVARAALRPTGLGAVLRELEKQLGCWVAFFDAAGNRVALTERIALPSELEPEVTDAARRALRKGTPAAVRLQTGSTGATLQTLGRQGNLRGVLVVGTGAPLDAAAVDLVASVIGLASIALEQSRALEAARMRVRAAVFELLLSGSLDAAGRTARRLWGRLPKGPVRVVLVRGGADSPPLVEELELLAGRRDGRVFFAPHDAGLVVITAHDDTAEAIAVLTNHELGGGVSSSLAWDQLRRGLTEADRAAARRRDRRAIASFDELAADGILGMLDAASGGAVAARLLRPILESERSDHRALLPTAAVWLDHNGAWEPAARALGVHRHTLRNRLQALEQLLDLDLTRFEDRVELWAALQFLPPSPEQSV